MLVVGFVATGIHIGAAFCCGCGVDGFVGCWPGRCGASIAGATLVGSTHAVGDHDDVGVGVIRHQERRAEGAGDLNLVADLQVAHEV